MLVSEAAVEAVLPLTKGRILVDQQGNVNTGLALANASPEDATVRLVLRDAHGFETGSSQIDLPAGHHMSRFVNELLPQATAGFLGSLTFETDDQSPLAAVTIRLSTNRHGEPVFATLPVVAMAGSEATPAEDQNRIIFPHIGAGGILSTQILLINTTPDRVKGSIALVGTNGQPLEMELDEVGGSEFFYDILGNGIFLGTLRTSEEILQGYTIITPLEGTGLPSGTAVFQFRDADDLLVSEAGVAATLPTQTVRIFVDTLATQTGLAFALPEGAGVASAPTLPQGPHEISFELFDLLGNSLGTRTLEMSSGAKTALFTDDIRLFPNVASGFQGILEVKSPIPMVAVTLKFTVNATARETCLLQIPSTTGSGASTRPVKSSKPWQETVNSSAVAVGSRTAQRLKPAWEIPAGWLLMRMETS